MREYCLLRLLGTANLKLRIFLLLLPLLTGCANLGYYWHTAKGHLAIMDKRVDIDDLIQNPETDAKLRQRLELVKEIRQFSIERLALPESDSYTSFAQLDRPYALQNLFAAPEFSTQLVTWCYPFAGCTTYRGFYEQHRLDDFVEGLKIDNHDIHIGRVPAYSTLGWFDDPVLSSFINWPDHRLAGLLFHELTHQKVYVDDDSKFNESLATAVQQVGIRLWLLAHGENDNLDQFNRSLLYRRDVVLLIEDTRDQLSDMYKNEESSESKRLQKQQVLMRLREKYEDVATAHNYRDGFANWFSSELNNAKLASVSTYNALVPAFVKMIEAQDNDFDAFFEYVQTIGDLNKDKRDSCLIAWQAGDATEDARCS